MSTFCIAGIFSLEEIADTTGTRTQATQAHYISAVCRNNRWYDVPVLAAADEVGNVRLFNYPCVVSGSPDKCYIGHSGSIASIRFSCSDEFCVSIGTRDGCVMVWATDVLEEVKERKALEIDLKVSGLTELQLKNRNKVATSISESMDVAVDDDSGFIVNEEEKAVDHIDFDEGRGVKSFPTGGDEFVAIRPWKGAVREPSTWHDKPNMKDAPSDTLELNFIYGYRGWVIYLFPFNKVIVNNITFYHLFRIFEIILDLLIVLLRLHIMLPALVLYMIANTTLKSSIRNTTTTSLVCVSTHMAIL